MSIELLREWDVGDLGMAASARKARRSIPLESLGLKQFYERKMQLITLIIVKTAILIKTTITLRH